MQTLTISMPIQKVVPVKGKRQQTNVKDFTSSFKVQNDPAAQITVKEFLDQNQEQQSHLFRSLTFPECCDRAYRVGLHKAIIKKTRLFRNFRMFGLFANEAEVAKFSVDDQHQLHRLRKFFMEELAHLTELPESKIYSLLNIELNNQNLLSWNKINTWMNKEKYRELMQENWDQQLNQKEMKPGKYLAKSHKIPKTPGYQNNSLDKVNSYKTSNL